MAWGNQYQRSESAHQAILTSAYELCLEVGYQALTMEAVARRAGVGKQTIYRWWPSKGLLLFDALQAAVEDWGEFPDTGDLAADLFAQMSVLAEAMSSPKVQPVLVGLVDGSHHDPRLADRLLTEVVNRRQKATMDRLQNAIDRGELPSDTDIVLLLDQLYGPLFYRMLVTREPIGAGYVRRHVAALLNGFPPAAR